MKTIKLFSILLLLAVLAMGCTQASNGQTNNPNGSDNSNGTATGLLKEFTIHAKQFEFNPSTITVNKGDRVKITLIADDVAHGFGLKEFNVNIRPEPETPKTVEFVADKTGTFTFICSVPCGPGHKEMTGTIIVQ